jgi:dihydrofolate reductase
MRNLIYAVATSLDNFIADPDGNIEMFPREGPHIEDYVEELLSYDTVIMGKNTYEFGYRQGLEEGVSLYPFMRNYVYSESLSFQPTDENLKIINSDSLGHIRLLKSYKGKPILLCGGGKLAGALIKQGLIDELHLRICPITLNTGIPMLGDFKGNVRLDELSKQEYENNVSFVKYKILT